MFEHECLLGDVLYVKVGIKHYVLNNYVHLNRTKSANEIAQVLCALVLQRKVRQLSIREQPHRDALRLHRERAGQRIGKRISG